MWGRAAFGPRAVVWGPLLYSIVAKLSFSLYGKDSIFKCLRISIDIALNISFASLYIF